MATAKPKLLTADDLLRMYSQGVRGELIRGMLHETPPSGMRQGMVNMAMATALGEYIYPRRLGHLFGTDAGVLLERNPDTVREPDLGYVSAEKLALDADVDGYCPVVPDLVVEVVPFFSTQEAVDDRATMWLDFGVRMALVINPETGTIRVRQPNLPTAVLTMDDTLDGGEVLPGFSCPVREILGS